MPRSHADRNLLFGILALQMDFVTRDQLIAGMHAWVLDKQTTLGRILRDQGALGDGALSALEALVEEHVKRHGDAERSLASLSSVTSIVADLKSIDDPDVRVSLGHASGAAEGEAADPYATRTSGSDGPATGGLRYRRLREHAAGGLGIVYVARDEELNREVALKEIKPVFADDPESRSRFVVEAEVTGGLEHPGIVPVYGLGKYDDGRPFYAMRFIRGDSLKEAIGRFHAAESSGRDPGERHLSLQKLLRRFLDVCNAVSYAHSRGILHRDLKPNNVMVGQYGETLVVDWGLAKTVGRTAAGSVASPEASLRPPSASGSAETLPGSVVGTPGYMSPEQAEGRLDLLGPASDVYSLGATLYALLTGKPAFQDKSVGEVLRKVRAGEFPRPRERSPWVDPALEAVCLKAMALAPGDRYPSARALADDIERWNADEPVSAYREPIGHRFARWRRRNRELSRVMAAAASLLILGAIAGGWYWRDQIRRESIRATAERQLMTAEARITAGEGEEARIVLAGAGALIAGESGFEAIRGRIAAASDRAEARSRVAAFTAAADRADFDILGGYWTLLPHEETAVRRRIVNPGERPADLARGAALARRALAELGVAAGRDPFSGLIDRGIGRAEAELVRRRAAELTFLLAAAEERLAQGAPPPAQSDARRLALRRIDEAEALGFRDRLADLIRADFQERAGDRAAAEALRTRAEGRQIRGFLDHHFAAAAHSRARRWDEAIAEFQAAVSLRPNDYWTLFRMAKALESAKQLARAESMYRACLTLNRDDPTVQNSLGTLLLSQKRWKQAADELEAVVGKHPDYLMAYTNLMMAYAELGDVGRTREVQRRLMDRKPDRSTISNAWNHLGLAHERAKQDQDALESYTRAIEIDPQSTRALRNRSTVFIRLKRYDEARADLEEAIRIDPKDGELLYVKGNMYAFSDRAEEAVAAYTEALRLDPRLIFARNNRALMLFDLKRFEEAIRDHEAVLEAAPNHPTALMDIATCHASIGQRDRNPAEYRIALNGVAAVLDRNPNDADALRLRGNLLGDLGKYQEGIGPDEDLKQSQADLTRFIRLRPDDPRGYHSRGKTRLKSEDWRGAIDDWLHYKRLRPDAPDMASIDNDLSTAYLELGDIPKAIESLARARRGKDHPSHHSNLGNIHLKQGDLPRAIEEFDRAIALDPKHTRAWALRGQARLRQGRFAEAVADLDRALALEPGFYETMVLCGTAKLAAGDEKAARSLLEAVVKDRSRNPRGHYALGRLRLLDGREGEAVVELSQATSDPILREFSLGPRARAWLTLGGGGLSVATADAEALCLARPRDGLAHLEAARIHARASAGATPEQSSRWRERALDLLDKALTLQPDLRPGVGSDAELRSLSDSPRFPRADAAGPG